MEAERKAFCLNSTFVVGQAAGIVEAENAKVHSILIANHILPTELTSILEVSQIRAVVLRYGSLADHTAGLLNGRGIQLAIVPDLPMVASGTAILIDGVNERILIGSDIEGLKFNYSSYSHSSNSTGQQKNLVLPCTLGYSGEQVSVHVDSNTAEELMLGITNGAVGVGILRTEWFGWSNTICPDAATQYKFYAECAAKVHPYRLNIRLFDIGGDKIPRWADDAMKHVQSPLGNRGVRAIRLLTEAFEHQLKAICGAAQNIQIGLVIPMVTDPSDIRLVRQKLTCAVDSEALRNIRLGAMIEVPTAAINIDSILPEVDFVRIGPGDLTQFTLAKLRMNIEPNELSGHSIHPAVLTLIENVTKSCRKAGKPVSMCLDIEPRTSLLRMLLSKGIRIFCVSPSNVQITVERLWEICT